MKSLDLSGFLLFRAAITTVPSTWVLILLHQLLYPYDALLASCYPVSSQRSLRLCSSAFTLLQQHVQQ